MQFIAEILSVKMASINLWWISFKKLLWPLLAYYKSWNGLLVCDYLRALRISAWTKRWLNQAAITYPRIQLNFWKFSFWISEISYLFLKCKRNHVKAQNQPICVNTNKSMVFVTCRSCVCVLQSIFMRPNLYPHLWIIVSAIINYTIHWTLPYEMERENIPKIRRWS